MLSKHGIPFVSTDPDLGLAQHTPWTHWHLVIRRSINRCICSSSAEHTLESNTHAQTTVCPPRRLWSPSRCITSSRCMLPHVSARMRRQQEAWHESSAVGSCCTCVPACVHIHRKILSMDCTVHPVVVCNLGSNTRHSAGCTLFKLHRSPCRASARSCLHRPHTRPKLCRRLACRGTMFDSSGCLLLYKAPACAGATAAAAAAAVPVACRLCPMLAASLCCLNHNTWAAGWPSC